MFIVHDLADGYVCKVNGETPNRGDVLCLELYRNGQVHFKVKEIKRYAEQSRNEATLGDYVVKAIVERIPRD